GGLWTLTTSALTAGSHTISASYSGDANFQSSNSPGLTQDVSRAATNVVLTAAPIPFRFRQNVIFSAAVSTSSSAPTTPTGVITFRDGSTTVCTARSEEHTSELQSR